MRTDALEKTSFFSRKSRAFRYDMGRNSCTGNPRLAALENRTITLLGSLTATLCRNTALARVKITLLAPMPRVSESTATRVKAGFFISMRAAYFKSCQKVSMEIPLIALSIVLDEDQSQEIARKNRVRVSHLRLFHHATAKWW